MNIESRLESVPEYFEDRFKNIIFARVDFAELVANTPLALIWSKGAITTTGFYLNNISDVLRRSGSLSCGALAAPTWTATSYL